MPDPARVCEECEGTGIFTLVSHRAMDGLYRELIDCPGCQGSGVELDLAKWASRWPLKPGQSAAPIDRATK